MSNATPKSSRDHPHRGALVDELHARPFPAISAPGFAWFVALRPEFRSDRDRAGEKAQLDRLISTACQTPPPPDATHWTGQLGPLMLKWESHTEFVTFLVWGAEESDVQELAEDILSHAENLRIASARFRIQVAEGDEPILERLRKDHLQDSLAASRVLDDHAVIAGDFHPDPAGDMRFSVYARPLIGPGRIGRIVQRLCEIETYRAMAMLGLVRAREMGPSLTDAETRLSAEVLRMNDSAGDAETALRTLLEVSGGLERLAARSNFRMSATAAYERIVTSRIDALREERFEGRQTFGEFMIRRFDPAMRTVEATERRLARLTDRARRAAELLRTRVEVDLSRQNRVLLESMDRRADEALRLQHTVEGLSVVAISYYATGLALYIAAPFGDAVGLGKTALAALITPIVVLLTWGALRQVRKRLH
ncbi:DUF3422 family protein [Pseudooceanicola atlanticus]|uniref:DUF3422 family protein n=1 Tax=Pseudooceanicola atlanticus TaxID=1461694 RepID=UPI0023539442|nr:DUF3422 domain-containing protein [Pseudooceanicola atlanticus]